MCILLIVPKSETNEEKNVYQTILEEPVNLFWTVYGTH